MWQTLGATSDALLKESTHCVTASRAELLQALAGLKASKGQRESIQEEGHGVRSSADAGDVVGQALEEAARLLSQLHSAAPDTDGGAAPGAILTPKGVAISHSLFKDARSGGAQALSDIAAETLLADLPSLRWDSAAATMSPMTGAADAAQALLAAGRAATNRRLDARRDALWEAAGDGAAGLQAEHAALQSDVHARLRELHRDISLVEIHARLREEAAASGDLRSQDTLRWFNVASDPDVVAETSRLLSALFHTSTGVTDAWARIAHALMTGLAAPDDATTRLLAQLRGLGPSVGASSAEAGATRERWAPEAFPDHMRELQSAAEAQLRGLIDQKGEASGEGRALAPGAAVPSSTETVRPRLGEGSEGQPRASPDDLAAYQRAVLPSTHLQAVGQKLLYHAAQQLPCLLALPERPPAWLLCTLYARPFSHAVRQTTEALVAAAHGPAQGVRRAAERERAALLPGAPASDTDRSPLDQALAALNHLIQMSRDIQGFEQGFAAILANCTHRGPCTGGRDSTALPPSACGHRQPASACMSVLREELSRALREARPMLRSFVSDTAMAAVQAYLGADARLRSVPVSPEVWPEADVIHKVPGTSPVGVDGTDETEGQLARHMPPAVDAASDQVLRFVGQLLTWAGQQPEPMQGPLTSAALECLTLLMDRLATLCTNLRDLPLGNSADGLGGCANSPGGSGASANSAGGGHTASGSGAGGSGTSVHGAAASRSGACKGAAIGGGGGGGGGAAGGSPLQPLLLFHSAACCVVRRLESMRPGLGAAAHDEELAMLVSQHGECLVQADELVTSLHDHILMAYTDVMQSVVLPAIDRVDWCAYRPAVRGVGSGGGAGPAVRLWHSLLVRLAHNAARCASLHTAEWLLGQVLLDSFACLAQRYLHCYPSRPMLPEYRSDVVHAAATAFLLCQPIPVDTPAGVPSHLDPHCVPRANASASSGAGPSAEAVGQPACRTLRVPLAMARELAATARELLIRAALLHVDGSRLMQIAAAVGLQRGAPLAPRSYDVAAEGAPRSGSNGGGCSAAVTEDGKLAQRSSRHAREEQAAAGQGAEVAGPSGSAAELSTGALSAPPASGTAPSLSASSPDSTPSSTVPQPLAPSPPPRAEPFMVPWPGPPEPLAPLAPLEAPHTPPLAQRTSASVAALPPVATTTDNGGRGASRLEPLPAILSHRAQPPAASSVRVAAGPIAEAVLGCSGDADASQSTASVDCGVHDGRGGSASGRAQGHDTHVPRDDEGPAERLAIWSAWLPEPIVRGLRDPGEAVDLRGPLLPTAHMPLGDRIAEEQPQDAWRQRPRANGRGWRQCLEQLAGTASQEQVLLALACRHELHGALGNEPPEVVDSRRAVRALARDLGLLQES